MNSIFCRKEEAPIRIYFLVCHFGDNEALHRTYKSLENVSPKSQIILITPNPKSVVDLVHKDSKIVADTMSGYYSALNLGFSYIASDSDYGIVVNSGDELSETFMAFDIQNILQEHKPKWCVGKTKILHEQFGLVRTTSNSPEMINQMLWGRNGYTHQSVIIQKQFFKQLNGFDRQYKICADLDFFRRASQISLPTQIDLEIGIFYLGGVSTKSILRLPLELHCMRVNNYEGKRVVSYKLVSIGVMITHIAIKAAKKVVGKTSPATLYRIRKFLAKHI